jgi:CheY-like chemotaxis protein
MTIETVRTVAGARAQASRMPASALGRLGVTPRSQGPAGTRKRVRVLIADDHAVVLRGLRSLLETQPDIEICGEAMNGLDVVEKAQALAPEMVILDIGMPELNGLEATRAIPLKHPNIEILVLTMHFPEQVARQILKAGARIPSENRLARATPCCHLEPTAAQAIFNVSGSGRGTDRVRGRGRSGDDQAGGGGFSVWSAEPARAAGDATAGRGVQQ